jgi:hypothetical protein
MRRLSAALLALAVLAVVAPGIAVSAKPDRTPIGDASITFDPGQVCDFAVRIDPVGNKQVTTTFSDGRQTITGRLSARVSRLDAGGSAVESVTINNSGPIFISPNEDGTVSVKGTGNTLFFFFPGDLGEGEPGALLRMTGLVQEVLPADFSAIISFSHRGGTTENLCETLAP